MAAGEIRTSAAMMAEAMRRGKGRHVDGAIIGNGGRGGGGCIAGSVGMAVDGPPMILFTKRPHQRGVSRCVGEEASIVLLSLLIFYRLLVMMMCLRLMD